MRMESQKIPKRLDGDDRARHPIPLWGLLLEKHLKASQAQRLSSESSERS
jgi:hypothetical protein